MSNRIKEVEELTMEDQVRQEVKEILKEQFELNEDINSDANLFEDIGVDSTGIIELLLSLEEKFDVEFDMEELDPEILTTVDTLTNYVVSLKE